MSYKAQLDAFLKERGVGSKTSFSIPRFEATGISAFPWSRIGLYILVITLIVLLVLVVIHFTIRPIFRFKSGNKGFITIPGISGADDGALYWPTIAHGELKESESIFGSQSTTTNCSMAIDLLFINLNVGTNSDGRNRPIFLRYNSNTSSISNPDYSVGMFLDPVVNDLYVRVRTTAANTEQVVLKNIVANSPLRIGVILQPTYFEVYRNGLLVQTHTLSHPPIDNIGTFWCNPGRDSTGADSSLCGAGDTSGTLGYGINLHLWPRALRAQEMQYSMPAMPTAESIIKSASKQGISGYLNEIRSELGSLGTVTDESLSNLTNSVSSAATNIVNSAQSATANITSNLTQATSTAN